MSLTEIKDYRLYQYSGAYSTGLIFLYDNENKHIGNAYFVKQDPLPPPFQNEREFISLYFHDNAFAFVVDMLRNEKPCYLWWFGKSGAISTSKEPVGESEFIG